MNLLEQHLPFTQSGTQMRRSLGQFVGVLFDAAFQFGIEPEQPFLGPFALGNVDDARQHERSLLRLDRAQATSMATSLPSLRRPYRSRPAPIGRVCGAAKKPCR